jgi:hypothetical protein
MVGDLCQACGVCCQVLFRYALLTDEEVDRLAKLRVPTTRRRNGEKALRLGCSALAGTRCGIYEARPKACDDFFCLLALRLRVGQVGYEEALGIVRAVQGMLSQMEEQLPPRAEDEPRSVIERAHDHGLSEGPQLLRRTEDFLREHFRGPGQP